MPDPNDLTPLLTGPVAVVVWKAGEWVVARFVTRAEKLEEKTESDLEKKVDLLLTKVTTIESDNRVAAERSAALNSVLGEVKGRIEGISANYGTRLSQLEKEMAVVSTKRVRK